MKKLIQIGAFLVFSLIIYFILNLMQPPVPEWLPSFFALLTFSLLNAFASFGVSKK